ncbi:MAG TPA: 23S rRNA (adenine(2503)-C(2))-methyltransferase RlmN [Elusimicrobia bacterium]|nr:MAG: 23S rRNA (adenine(2503)-C(2))-methyltransferase [Elusimicrobia bacterium RIFOXYA12_FULL_49_49]OGS15268.1 MAG: 23S rRNA (adenine(2503)-C(2))-methyltransferase [Elusimicrobia bacterium RIFOXYA2_FULL_47_53]OGS26931.1 MAG: 23S rRNA (adenine(2503)-C(2))-methyltransferase [Elusimicrobia bacterium RIFOXYB12_FULL_50_12]OGS30523.1 MAG: 23S rRNA (adenine(2503)-C(2))-methyltransferase [Elusimicrobia bacterium RIFOXYB2_FULL_46_23]HBU69217.1 23S rRNA (adenine(2503)-C(2))-methyltransferase RlmN [Elus
MTKEYILDIEPAALIEKLKGLGLEPYRFKQVFSWIYEKGAGDFALFANLPQQAREKLAGAFDLRALAVASKKESRIDGTVRYNFKTRDGYYFSTVYLPSERGASVCLSTQVGCPAGCYFCASGKVKFKRNLSRGEIIEQALAVQNDRNEKITGVLFMGMGEPLLNIKNLVSSIKVFLDPKAFGIGRKHITVSTVGIVPKIFEFSREELGVRLALSLHAPDDEIRSKFIPTKFAFPVKDVFNAGLEYSRRNNARLTIEYILASGVNDTKECAVKLTELIEEETGEKDDIQVNLIPYNSNTRSSFKTSDMKATDSFMKVLKKSNILSIVRAAKGIDIEAACGQLGV